MYSSSQQDDEVSKLVRELRWEDTFFDQEEGLIAVFDFDYEKMISFYAEVDVNTAVLYPIKWKAYSMHVAITRDGIKFVQDRYKTIWGYPSCDVAKTSKTVPFDKITDCNITEPAGNTCCVENVLSKVSVDTASGSSVGMYELSLRGLKEPEKFVKLVWAMKRANRRGIAPTAFAVPVEATARGIAPTAFAVPSKSSMGDTAMGIEMSAPTSLVAPFQSIMDRETTNEETNAILLDIRNQLVEVNANMKSTNK